MVLALGPTGTVVAVPDVQSIHSSTSYRGGAVNPRPHSLTEVPPYLSNWGFGTALSVFVPRFVVPTGAERFMRHPFGTTCDVISFPATAFNDAAAVRQRGSWRCRMLVSPAHLGSSNLGRCGPARFWCRRPARWFAFPTPRSTALVLSEQSVTDSFVAAIPVRNARLLEATAH